MTWIDNRKHPRKRDWSYFMCDMCFQNFWGPEGRGADGASHMCAGCMSLGSMPTGHFAGNHMPAVIHTHDGDWDPMADWGSYYDVARRAYEESDR